ncbi:hypothetical protein JTE90_016707 [Oedothorax gibbosus]|uniref:Uncharacterized protein n=1 Tax=Oedothorax gibbosus TaxID=931172 RepID=A0AAV6V1N5_9ARAC|nr:hypothetical protein JTE90_016707 [Oedothorax gibbosus]
MFYNSMWGNYPGFGRQISPDVMWSAYRKLFAVDLDHLPDDAADPDHPLGSMRPSLSPPPSKRPLLVEEGPDNPRAPPRMNGASKKMGPEEEKIQEYLQRSDTAVIFPEPVGGKDSERNESPKPAIGKSMF